MAPVGDDDDREQVYLAMIEQVPESALPWFSLGRYYLETGSYAKAAEALRRCTQLQANYAAALFALGEACAGAGQTAEARGAFLACQRAALAQNHPSLAEEAAEKERELPA
jgi:cytochrome c-type biogenesis protein CcmH/NrfG